MFLQILVDELEWNKSDDLLDLTAKLDVIMNGRGLPAEYFPGSSMEVRLYETAFELLDLLGHLITSKEKGGMISAELCYTGNFLEVNAGGFPALEVSIRFNPISVDNEELLDGGVYTESARFEDIAKEILIFAIATFELILNHNNEFEDELLGLQSTILRYQDTLENEYKVELFPPDESA
ncbi:MAG: hypothetical protein ACTSUE_02825 [Promethearchaeota archaeon]